MLSLIKATRFDQCHPYFAWFFMALSINMVINAVQICIITWEMKLAANKYRFTEVNLLSDSTVLVSLDNVFNLNNSEDSLKFEIISFFKAD